MYNNFPFPENYMSQNMGQNLGSQAFLGNRQGITRVNGENGAMAFPMRPNSEVLLLDDTQAVVWHKQTDGAGYPTLNGYLLSPLKSKEQMAEDKYTQIEKRLTNLEAIINDKPHITELAVSTDTELDKDSKRHK